MLDSSPDKVRAIVVGIDHYDQGGDWHLTGPSNDALRTVEWLLLNGVDQRHIALFLSPQSWTEHKLMVWLDKHRWQRQRHATSIQICSFIDGELATLKGESLLLHWGGHGAVDDKSFDQYLFTCDATSATPYCMSTDNLLEAAGDKRLAHLSKQLHIVDVCAIQYHMMTMPVNPCPRPLVTSSIRQAETEQCVMYSSSLGRGAADLGAGAFTQQLMEIVQKPKAPPPGLHQFIDAFHTLKGNWQTNGLHAQMPRIVMPGETRRQAYARERSDIVADLLGHLTARDIGLHRLRRFYLQSRPEMARNFGHELVEWLRDLADARPRTSDGYPSPLIEFAERVGRDLESEELKHWARGRCEQGLGQYRLLTAKLDAEAAQNNQLYATLFIEIAGMAATELHWFLSTEDEAEATTRKRVAVDQAQLCSSIAQHLPDIVANAVALTSHNYQLRIGFVVPAELFVCGLESLDISGPDEPPCMLNQRYPVVFHWYPRISNPATYQSKAWQQILAPVTQRIVAGDSAKLSWLEPCSNQADASRYVRASYELKQGAEAAVCLGIDHPHRDPQPANLHTIKQCLMHGVPCLFWLQRPQRSKDAAALRQRAELAFAQLAPKNAPMRLWEQQQRAGPQRLRPHAIVWDVEGFYPTTDLLEDQ